MEILTFGVFLREKRKERKITLRHLASELGVSPTYMSYVEIGHKPSPKRDKIEKIAEILGLSYDDKNLLFDLAAKSKTDVASPDLAEYVMGSEKCREVIRYARDNDIGDDAWKEILCLLQAKTEDENIPAVKEKHCSVCGRKIVWEHPDVPGLFLESSDNIPDWPICRSCMEEHCCSTDCSKCEYNKEPSCEFQYLKDIYQDLSD